MTMLSMDLMRHVSTIPAPVDTPDAEAFFKRHAHIIRAAQLILMAEVKRNGRCPFYVATARVYRLPALTKRFAKDGVSEYRLRYLLTTAHTMGAFLGLGLRHKSGSGMVPDWEDKAAVAADPSGVMDLAAAEARGKMKARREVLAALAVKEDEAYRAELERLQKVVGLR